MKLSKGLLTLAIAAATPLANAQMVDVKITNLTQAIYFTPILATAHSTGHLFQVGEEASSALQTMAEGGDISGLVTIADSISASSQSNPANGLLGPTASTMINDWDTGDNDQLTIVAMLLPTNDGFVGLDSWTIPETAGEYTIYLNAYDAGTEANDELIVDGGGAAGTPGIPADPSGLGGSGGSGVTSDSPNSMIHIHPGSVGDTDDDGGDSDLNSRVHRWLNPVAKVVVTVK